MLGKNFAQKEFVIWNMAILTVAICLLNFRFPIKIFLQSYFVCDKITLTDDLTVHQHSTI